jgi:hypothetical protein
MQSKFLSVALLAACLFTCTYVAPLAKHDVTLSSISTLTKSPSKGSTTSISPVNGAKTQTIERDPAVQDAFNKFVESIATASRA